MQKLLATAVTRPQKCPDVWQYCREHFGTQYLPADYIKFLSLTDGLQTPKATFLAINDEPKEVVLLLSRYAEPKVTESFLAPFHLQPQQGRYFFFAVDGRAGRYAFRTDQPDEQVYHFNQWQPGRIAVYPSFSALLEKCLPTK